MSNDFIPYGKIHEIQISDKEMYAFNPVLCDAISEHKREIADLRKKIGIPSEYPDTVDMLARIQSLEGQIVILEDILEQLDLS